MAPALFALAIESAPLKESAALTPACVRIAHAVEPGAAPIAADFEPAPCPAAPSSAPLRYDRTDHVLKARKRLDTGEIFLAPPAALLAAIREGQILRLRVGAGPVIVERTVTAFKAARRGGAVFVRTADDIIFSAPLLQGAP